MRQAARRWALLVAVGLLVVVLVGGRWAAFETAERVWATSVPGGSAYLKARDFAQRIAHTLDLFMIDILRIDHAHAGGRSIERDVGTRR